MSSPNIRVIPRDKLFAIFKTEEAVRMVEDMLQAINDLIPADTTALEQALDAHIDDTTDAHQASAIGATPGGSRVSNNVQGQLGNLDSSKLAANLVSVFALTLLDDANASDARATLGLSSMSTQSAGSVVITGGSVRATTGLGYAASAFGTVTQTLSKSNSVTLNTLSGEITMDGAGLGAGATASFTLNNTSMAARDLIVIHPVAFGAPEDYDVKGVCGAGSGTIYVTNTTGGVLSDSLVLRFALIKL